MGEVTKKMLDHTYFYCILNDEEAYEYGLESERVINQIEVKIHNFLVEIGSKDLTNSQMLRVAKDIDTITDLERIGDHLENIIEFFTIAKENNRTLNDSAMEEIKHLFEYVHEQLEDALKSYFTNDKNLARTVQQKEYELNRIIKEYRNNHIIRCRDAADSNGNSYFVDILSNLERIGDHADNIAENVAFEKFSYHVKAIK